MNGFREKQPPANRFSFFPHHPLARCSLRPDATRPVGCRATQRTHAAALFCTAVLSPVRGGEETGEHGRERSEDQAAHCTAPLSLFPSLSPFAAAAFLFPPRPLPRFPFVSPSPPLLPVRCLASTSSSTDSSRRMKIVRATGKQTAAVAEHVDRRRGATRRRPVRLLGCYSNTRRRPIGSLVSAALSSADRARVRVCVCVCVCP